MNKLAMHAIVSSFAILLALSALYMFSERDRYSTVFYGHLPRLIIPPNTNATIPLVYVSDRHEIGNLTVFLNKWESLNHSASISRPTSHSLEMNFYAAMHVNKSAFVLLEELADYSDVNRTVEAIAFHSTNFPFGSKSTEAKPIQSRIQLNNLYQLKIGNYETFIKNQTGPLQFTTHRTNTTLEAVITTSLYSAGSFIPQAYTIAVSFIKEPNVYLAASLFIADAVLVTVYLMAATKHGRHEGKMPTV